MILGMCIILGLVTIFVNNVIWYSVYIRFYSKVSTLFPPQILIETQMYIGMCFLVLKIQTYCYWEMETEPVTTIIFSSVEIYLREKVTNFHNALRYLFYETEIKTLFQSK